jgi:hypothetical protein
MSRRDNVAVVVARLAGDAHSVPVSIDANRRTDTLWVSLLWEVKCLSRVSGDNDNGPHNASVLEFGLHGCMQARRALKLSLSETRNAENKGLVGAGRFERPIACAQGGACDS